jgi:small-conductance mechanosensitive channel
MKISRVWLISLLSLSVVVLVSVGILGSWYAPSFGDAGLRLQGYLVRPLFSMGGLSITLFFLTKAAIFMVLLFLFSHITMVVLRNRVLTHTPLTTGSQYAVAKVISYLVFALGLFVGLQSLGLNLSSLVVVGGRWELASDWACRPS